MQDHDTTIFYGRRDDGLTQIADLFQDLITADFGDQVALLVQEARDVTGAIFQTVDKDQTHVFDAEYLCDSEEIGFRTRYDFFNKSTAVMEMSLAFTHGWHKRRGHPKHYNNPKLIKPVIDAYIEEAMIIGRNPEHVATYALVAERLLSAKFMKGRKLYAEEAMEESGRLSLLWFPLEYDGLIIRLDLWLAPQAFAQVEEDNRFTHHYHH